MIKTWGNDDIQDKEAFGNQVLYDMCSKVPYHNDEGIVGGKCWLIGRAYAASPQRRRTKDKSNNTEGYDFFFDRLGSEIVKNGKAVILDEGIRTFSTASYTGSYEKDILLLLKSMEMVNLMNELIRESLTKIDRPSDQNNDEINGVNNTISFSSKYIHFHMRNIVYIYDKYSRVNAPAVYKALGLNNQMKNAIAKDLRTTFLEAHMAEYRRHVANCYSLSLQISKSFLLNPRCIDTFLLREMWNGGTPT